jgi:hypothetical protein
MARGTAVGFAEAQAGWIAARLKRLPDRRPFADGAEVPLFGEPHSSAIAPTGAARCGARRGRSTSPAGQNICRDGCATG